MSSLYTCTGDNDHLSLRKSHITKKRAKATAWLTHALSQITHSFFLLFFELYFHNSRLCRWCWWWGRRNSSAVLLVLLLYTSKTRWVLLWLDFSREKHFIFRVISHPHSLSYRFTIQLMTLSFSIWQKKWWCISKGLHACRYFIQQ